MATYRFTFEMEAIATPCPNVIQVRYSDDGGRNWSQWRNKELGVEGDRLTPCVFRQMGRTQHRIYQFRDTSPYRHDLIDVGVSVAI